MQKVISKSQNLISPVSGLSKRLNFMTIILINFKQADFTDSKPFYLKGKQKRASEHRLMYTPDQCHCLMKAKV